MKRIYYLLILLTLMSASSCKKFLDKPQLEDALSPSLYFQTEAQLDLALRGVYDILQSSELYRTDFHYLKGWEADEGFARAPGFTTQMNSNHFTSSTPDVFNYWRDLYKGIARANILIANVNNNLGIDQAVRDQIRGEALFLRGYYYFLLVQSWGGVPLVTEPTTSIENTDRAKSTDVEVYEQILKDMTEAETLVPKITSLGFSGRVNKSAVRGILARVCLQWAGHPIKDVSKYAEAKKWAGLVIKDAEAGHRLNPSYSDVFIQIAQDKYDIKESIWEVEFSGNGTGTFDADAGQVGYNSGAVQGNSPAGVASLVGNAPGYMWVTANLYNSYEPGDLRKGWNIQNYNLTYLKVRSFKALPATQQAIYLFPHAKWRREYEIVEPRNASLTPQNFAILRYSDVLLMFAEADNHGDRSPDAEIYVNLVRRRAYAIGGIKEIKVTNGGANYTSAPTVTISGGGGAIATATILDGKVNTVTLTRNHVTDWNYGTYTTTPTVSFSGGGGAGAAATVTLFTENDADMPKDLSQKDFLTFIQNERRRELCFESLRKFDLIRWGIYVSTMHDAANTAIADNVPGLASIRHFPTWYQLVTDKHLLLPVPDQELTNNKLMVQNLGW